MILKRIYDEYGFNIESLLIKEYKRLKLTTNELSVLLVLFSSNLKRRVFSINSIARKVDFSTNELAEIIESLMEKEFVKITIEINNKREREVLELDGTFKHITDLFESDKLDKAKEVTVSNVSESISNLEEKFGRMLRSNELERIRTWYETYKFDHLNIMNIITSLDKEVSIIYIEKLLNLNGVEPAKIDSKTDELLDSIFNKL